MVYEEKKWDRINQSLLPRAMEIGSLRREGKEERVMATSYVSCIDWYKIKIIELLC